MRERKLVMNAKDILKQLDEMRGNATTEETASWLLGVIASLQTDHPEAIAEQGALYSELGSIYRNAGMYDKGEEAYLTSLRFFKEYADSDNAQGIDGLNAVDCATTMTNLAGLYRMQGDFEKAIQLFKQAQSQYHNAHCAPPGLHASAYNNLGITYMDMGRYEKSLEEFKKAADILSRTAEETHFKASLLGNIAYALHELGDNEQAAKILRDAANLYEKLGKEGAVAARKCRETANRLESM